MLLNENDPENANRNLEEAKSIAPRITMDVRFSLEINKGRLALERALSLTSIARKEGYEVKAIEDYYDKANSLFNEAKELYKNEEYDKIDSKIESVLELTDKISNKVEELKEPIQTSETPTGFMIINYSWLSYVIGIVAIVLVITLVVIKVRRRKKELKGIPKLVRIKCRLE
jgi:ABC-type antimicrobial peptide transport system permease subunit